MHEIELVERYTAFLKEHGVQFFENGFPIFQKEWFITTRPKVIAPYNKRQYYKKANQIYPFVILKKTSTYIQD